MKRDLELIRALCLALETSAGERVDEVLEKQGYSLEQVGFHSYLLGDAGYAAVLDRTCLGDKVPQAIPMHLTWRGYEFLESAREDARWKKAKSALAKVGGASLDVAIELLKNYAKKELGL